VQFKISLEEMRHICLRLGAARPALWRSLAWELQVVWRRLCTSTVISDARTASVFLNGHRPLNARSSHYIYMRQHGHRTAPPQITRFLKAVPRKKLSDIVNFPHKKLSDIANFLKSLEFWRNFMYQMMQLKMHGF
jgi:hypothetical protein